MKVFTTGQVAKICKVAHPAPSANGSIPAGLRDTASRARRIDGFRVNI